MVVSQWRGEVLASAIDGIAMSFKSTMKLRRAMAFRAVELAVRADRFHERVVTLPLKEEQSEDIPVLRGMEDIVKVVRRLRPFERVQHRTAEQCGRVQQQTFERTVDLPLRPESSVEVAGSSPRERVQQLTAEQIEDVLQLPEEAVEAVTPVQHERVRRRVAERIGDVSQFREEVVDEEAPETASQDWLPSWTMSRLPKLPFRSEFLKGCLNSPALSRCPRILARRMSRYHLGGNDYRPHTTHNTTTTPPPQHHHNTPPQHTTPHTRQPTVILRVSSSREK